MRRQIVCIFAIQLLVFCEQAIGQFSLHPNILESPSSFPEVIGGEGYSFGRKFLCGDCCVAPVYVGTMVQTIPPIPFSRPYEKTSQRLYGIYAAKMDGKTRVYCSIPESLQVEPAIDNVFSNSVGEVWFKVAHINGEKFVKWQVSTEVSRFETKESWFSSAVLPPDLPTAIVSPSLAGFELASARERTIMHLGGRGDNVVLWNNKDDQLSVGMFQNGRWKWKVEESSIYEESRFLKSQCKSILVPMIQEECSKTPVVLIENTNKSFSVIVLENSICTRLGNWVGGSVETPLLSPNGKKLVLAFTNESRLKNALIIDLKDDTSLVMNTDSFRMKTVMGINNDGSVVFSGVGTIESVDPSTNEVLVIFTFE
jgi:hypothetical protein